MQLVGHNSRIDRSIIVAIVVWPAVAMLCYLLEHLHHRRPTDSPSPVRLNFVCYCSLTDPVVDADATMGQLPIDCVAATVAGIVTMIRPLMFPRNTLIHCLRCISDLGICAKYMCVRT